MLFFHIWEESYQLTFIFFRGVGQPTTSPKDHSLDFALPMVHGALGRAVGMTVVAEEI